MAVCRIEARGSQWGSGSRCSLPVTAGSATTSPRPTSSNGQLSVDQSTSRSGAGRRDRSSLGRGSAETRLKVALRCAEPGVGERVIGIDGRERELSNGERHANQRVEGLFATVGPGPLPFGGPRPDHSEVSWQLTRRRRPPPAPVMPGRARLRDQKMALRPVDTVRWVDVMELHGRAEVL